MDTFFLVFSLILGSVVGIVLCTYFYFSGRQQKKPKIKRILPSPRLKDINDLSKKLDLTKDELIIFTLDHFASTLADHPYLLDYFKREANLYKNTYIPFVISNKDDNV